MSRSGCRRVLFAVLSIVAAALPVVAQHGAKNGEWRFYGGDAGSTKYSPLDQINARTSRTCRSCGAGNRELRPPPDFNWEVTPLMVDGVLYFTAGSRRDAVAVDAATGETLWMYRLDEGERGTARPHARRGLAYWTDGKGDERS